jgi:hypothetical protein
MSRSSEMGLDVGGYLAHGSGVPEPHGDASCIGSGLNVEPDIPGRVRVLRCFSGARYRARICLWSCTGAPIAGSKEVGETHLDLMPALGPEKTAVVSPTKLLARVSRQECVQRRGVGELGSPSHGSVITLAFP